MTTDAAAAATAHRALAALADRAAPPAARTAALRTLTALLRAHTPLAPALLARTATALVTALAAAPPGAPAVAIATATALTAALLDPATVAALRSSTSGNATPSSAPVPLIDRAAALLVRSAAHTLAPAPAPEPLAALLRALSAALAADRATAARHALAALALAADVLRTAAAGARAHVQALFCVRHCAAAAPAAAMQAWPRLLGAPRAPLLACLAARPPRRAAVAADTLAALVAAARPFLAVASSSSSHAGSSHAGFTPLSAAVADALCRAHRAVTHALGVHTGERGVGGARAWLLARLCRCLQALAGAGGRLDAALPAEGLAALLPLLARRPHDAAARDAAAALAAAQPPAAPLARLLATPRAARWLDALAAALEGVRPFSGHVDDHEHDIVWQEREQTDDSDDDEQEDDDNEEEQDEEETPRGGEHVESEAETAAGVRALFAVAQTYGVVAEARLARVAQCVLAAATGGPRRAPALVGTVCAAAARLPPPARAAVWRACAPALLAALAHADTADAVLGLCAHLDAAGLRALDDAHAHVPDGSGSERLVAAVLGAAAHGAPRAALAAAARFLCCSEHWAAHPAAVARVATAALAAAPVRACRAAALSCLATAARYAPALDRALCTALCAALADAATTTDSDDSDDAATALRGIAAVCAARAAPTAAAAHTLEACVLAGLRARAPKTQWNACIAARAVLAAGAPTEDDNDHDGSAHAALVHALVFGAVARADSCKVRVHACAALQALRTRAALGADCARVLAALAAAVRRAAADAYSPATRRYRPALLASVCAPLPPRTAAASAHTFTFTHLQHGTAARGVLQHRGPGRRRRHGRGARGRARARRQRRTARVRGDRARRRAVRTGARTPGPREAARHTVDSTRTHAHRHTQ